MWIKRKGEMFLNSYLKIQLIFYFMQPSGDSSQLKRIFDSFDLDKSGSIDIKQLGNVSSKLGKQLTQDELATIVKNLDMNKDGKITYGEFQYWWVKGMQGKMAEIVYLKAKAMKMTNFIKKKFLDAGINFEGHKGNVKPDKYDFKIRFGIQNQDAIKVGFSFYLKGQKQLELRQRIKSMLPQLNDKQVGFVLKFPSKNPAQAKVALDQILNSIISKQQLPIKIDSLESNPFVGVKTFARQNDLIIKFVLQSQLENAYSPASTAAESVIQQVGNGFYSYLDINLSINSSVDQILADPVIDSILRGFHLGLDLQANNSALSKIRKLGQKQNASLPVPFNLLSLFRSAKFHLNIKNPQHLSSFMKKMGIQDIVEGLPKVKDLLDQMSPRLKQAQDGDFIMKLIRKFSTYIFKHVQNNVEIFFLGGPVGTASLQLQGKNITKIHSILFNQ